MEEGAGAVSASVVAVDEFQVRLAVVQEEKGDGFTPFVQVGGLHVRLQDVVKNLPGLGRFLQPLLVGGKKVTRVRKVLQCAAKKYRYLDTLEPLTRKRKRGKEGDFGGGSRPGSDARVRAAL